MNSEMSKPVGSKEFLNSIEGFDAKLKTGKTKGADINEFYELISSKVKGSKKITGAVVQDYKKETQKALVELQKTLGLKKAVIESAVPAIPYKAIKEAVDSLVLYVNKQKKEAQKVARKEPDQMLGGGER